MIMPNEKNTDHAAEVGYSLRPSKKVMLCSISVAWRDSSPISFPVTTSARFSTSSELEPMINCCAEMEVESEDWEEFMIFERLERR